MVLSKKTIEIICEALGERSRVTSDAQRTAPTSSMRKAAENDFKETHTAWEEIEKYKRETEKS